MVRRPMVERPVLVALLLLLLISVIFFPVTGFNFINYDDPAYISGNPQVARGLTWQGVGWAFTHSRVANWHPVTWLSHMLDCDLYGLSPGGHHLTNVIFHLADSVLLFLFLRYLTGALWRSALVAALFAVHPLHVESVAWVSERKDVLSAFFGLSSLWAYAAYARASLGKPPEPQSANPGHDSTTALKTKRRHLAFYLLSCLFFALGLMSKAMLVTWPFVLLLLDFWPLRRFQTGKQSTLGARFKTFGRLLAEKVPFFVLAAAAVIITLVVVEGELGSTPSSLQVPLGLRLANVPINYVRYLHKMVWPVHLAVVYPYVLHWPAWEVIASALLLLGITVFLFVQRRTRPYLLTGWLWFLGTLVPVIGLVQAGNQSIADRFTYLPSIGLFVAVAWLCGDIARQNSGRRAVIGVAAAAMLIVCTVMSHAQVLHWRDSETLFQYAVSVTTNNFTAYTNLGLWYSDLGQPERAGRCFRQALAIQPGDRFAWQGLASVLIAQGHYQEAALSCQNALQIDPGMATAHGTLGLALAKLGKSNDAIEQYIEALRLDPTLADTHYNLANALAAQNQIEGACEHYALAVRFNPALADAHNNLAYLLVRRGKLDDAVNEFQAALALKPGFWQADYGLAEALVLQGKSAQAAQSYRRALKARPEFPEALTRVAWLLATDPDSSLRNGPEAVSLAQRACQLTQYKQLGPLRALAAAYAEAGRFDDAVDCADKARTLALASGAKNVSDNLDDLLRLFRNGHPYRSPQFESDHRK